MPNIIEITDFSAPELDIYARLTEVQLLNREFPEKGMFIAESPKVIERALDAGYEPISMLVEDKHIEGEAKEIIAKVSEEKAANLPQQMIENIAKGRLGKFLKEVCLLNQEDIMDGKKTVRETMKEADADLQILAFKRFTLRAE